MKMLWQGWVMTPFEATNAPAIVIPLPEWCRMLWRKTMAATVHRGQVPEGVVALNRTPKPVWAWPQLFSRMLPSNRMRWPAFVIRHNSRLHGRRGHVRNF